MSYYQFGPSSIYVWDPVSIQASWNDVLEFCATSHRSRLRVLLDMLLLRGPDRECR